MYYKLFVHIKTEITKPNVIALFDVNTDVKVSAGASSFGLRAEDYFLLETCGICLQGNVRHSMQVCSD